MAEITDKTIMLAEDEMALSVEYYDITDHTGFLVYLRPTPRHPVSFPRRPIGILTISRDLRNAVLDALVKHGIDTTYLGAAT